MGDMPNHAFIAIMTQNQINGTFGKKWLEVLKEHGFEFIRSVDNSVYSGPKLGKPTAAGHGHVNHIFMLIRNIGTNALKDPFTPPKAWTDISGGKSAAHEFTEMFGEEALDMAKEQHEFDTAVWNKIGPAKFYTEAELEKDSIPIWYAGVRNKYPQELKDSRLSKKALENIDKGSAKPKDPFACLNEATDAA